MKIIRIIGVLVLLLFVIGSASACSISLDKSALTTKYDTKGQIITYKYVVKNTGSEHIIGPITVKDNKIGTFTIPNSDLAYGASVVGTATYTIKQKDLDAGSVTNIAQAQGTYKKGSGSGQVYSNKDSVKITAI